MISASCSYFRTTMFQVLLQNMACVYYNCQTNGNNVRYISINIPRISHLSSVLRITPQNYALFHVHWAFSPTPEITAVMNVTITNTFPRELGFRSALKRTDIGIITSIRQGLTISSRVLSFQSRSNLKSAHNRLNWDTQKSSLISCL